MIENPFSLKKHMNQNEGSPAAHNTPRSHNITPEQFQHPTQKQTNALDTRTIKLGNMSSDESPRVGKATALSGDASAAAVMVQVSTEYMAGTVC